MALIIEGGLLIDGTGREPIRDAVVAIDNGVIRYAGAKSEWHAQQSEDHVIDAMGKTVLPALMDMHVHLCVPLQTDNPVYQGYSQTERSVLLSALHGLSNARTLALRGILSVRDVAAHGRGIFAVKHLIDNGQAVGPRITPCGRAIAISGGHYLLGSVEADGAEGVIRAVRGEMAAGAEALKFMASAGGESYDESPDDVQFLEEELAAGIAAAKSRGRTTAAHAVNSTSAQNAIRAGINSIEHGLLLDEETLVMMREHGVSFVPTVWIYEFTAFQGEYHHMVQDIIDRIRTQVSGHRDIVRRAHELGVPICVGTDHDVPVDHGKVIFWEIQWLGACGMSNMDALLAATRNPARLLRVDNRLGTLEEGKIADVLVVDGNPLDDLAVLSQTSAVIKGGEILVENGTPQVGETVIRDVGTPIPDGPVPSQVLQPT